MSWYRRAISSVAFSCMIAMMVPLAFLFPLMILMWDRACWWSGLLLLTYSITSSIILRSGLHSSLSRLKRLSAMDDSAVGGGYRPEGTLWLWVWGWTVFQHLAGDGISFGFGSCCGSVCCLRSSFCLGLGFGCGSSCCLSGSSSCVAPAYYESSRHPPSCLAVSSWFSFLAF